LFGRTADRLRTFFSVPRNRNITLLVLVLLVLSAIIQVPEPHVSLAAEPILSQGPRWLTNSLVTTLVVDVVILAMALAAVIGMKEVPSGWQNVMEMLVEGIHNLTENVSGHGTVWTKRFFPWVMTIFIYVLVSNYIGLLPGVGSIGFYHPAEGAKKEAVLVEEVAQDPDMGDGVLAASVPVGAPAEDKAKEVFIPLFRAPSADLNMTFALAIISVVMTQVFGYQALGGKYFKKFFNFGGKGFLGVIQAVVGILELILEFAKIISFSFRLFGNIFAGEVLLFVMAFLVTFLVPIPFYGLELFVGFIQALVFMLLTLVFFTMATVSHDEHH